MLLQSNNNNNDRHELMRDIVDISPFGNYTTMPMYLHVLFGLEPPRTEVTLEFIFSSVFLASTSVFSHFHFGAPVYVLRESF